MHFWHFGNSRRKVQLDFCKNLKEPGVESENSPKTTLTFRAFSAMDGFKR